MSLSCTFDSIITENLNGYIDVKDDLFQTIWLAIDLDAAITIKMKNLSNHLMRLKIEGIEDTIIKICPNDEQNITAVNVYRIAVQFNNKEKETCTGSYQIIIHYLLTFKKYNKNTKDFCNENNQSKITDLHNY